MLPHVVRRNGQHAEAWYRELAESDGDMSLADKPGSAADAIAGFVSEVSRKAGLAGKLSECDVSRENLPKLATAATQQWTGKFNPVELSGDDYLKLYDAAF
jgi:alcohol dehydrogenase class IV